MAATKKCADPGTGSTDKPANLRTPRGALSCFNAIVFEVTGQFDRDCLLPSAAPESPLGKIPQTAGAKPACEGERDAGQRDIHALPLKEHAAAQCKQQQGKQPHDTGQLNQKCIACPACRERPGVGAQHPGQRAR